MRTPNYHRKAEAALSQLTHIAAVASGHPAGEVARRAVVQGQASWLEGRDLSAYTIAEAALYRIANFPALEGTDVGQFACSALRELHD